MTEQRGCEHSKVKPCCVWDVLDPTGTWQYCESGARGDACCRGASHPGCERRRAHQRTMYLKETSEPSSCAEWGCFDHLGEKNDYCNVDGSACCNDEGHSGCNLRLIRRGLSERDLQMNYMKDSRFNGGCIDYRSGKRLDDCYWHKHGGQCCHSRRESERARFTRQSTYDQDLEMHQDDNSDDCSLGYETDEGDDCSYGYSDGEDGDYGMTDDDDPGQSSEGEESVQTPGDSYLNPWAQLSAERLHSTMAAVMMQPRDRPDCQPPSPSQVARFNAGSFILADWLDGSIHRCINLAQFRSLSADVRKHFFNSEPFRKVMHDWHACGLPGVRHSGSQQAPQPQPSQPPPPPASQSHFTQF